MSKKKYDKTTVAVVAVCIVLLFGWNTIFGPNGLNWLPQPQPQKQIEKTVTSEDVNTKPVSETRTAVQKTDVSVSGKTSETQVEKKAVADVSYDEWTNKYPIVKLISPDSLYTMDIDPVKGEIASVTLNKVKNAKNTDAVILARGITPGALSISPPVDGKDIWKLVDVKPPVNDNGILTVTRDFVNDSKQKFSITQKWAAGDKYSTEYDVSIQNKSSKVLSIRTLNFYVGSIPPVKYISGDKVRMESHTVDALLAKSDDLYTLKVGSSDFQKDPIQFEPVKWVAVSDAYYAYILKAVGNTQINAGNFNYSDNESITTKNGKGENYELIGSAAREQSITLKPNDTQSWTFDFYAGPKDINNLEAFAPKAGGILHLMSWPVFRNIAEWFLYALIWLNGIFGNFGVAIIILTIVVKGVFWPITHKSNKSMKRMQKIQPMVKELRAQYKDDKQKLNQATMELYKKEKVNPLGGCLPIVIQIPVFIALYYTLMGAFEIRHASFLWAVDLAQPDTVGHIFGLPINPFAILMAITMLLQQKMMPTATDPAQAKMMMLMPLVMLIFLYDLPSGLTLYWTVSQLITIIQLLYNKYCDKDEGKDFTKVDKKGYKNKKLKA